MSTNHNPNSRFMQSTFEMELNGMSLNNSIMDLSNYELNTITPLVDAFLLGPKKCSNTDKI